MRIYEELFIVKPDAPDEEVDALVETLRTQLSLWAPR
jgi:ribosomal protein S6